MELTTKKHGVKAIIVTVTIPWQDVDHQYQAIVETLVKEVEVQGFRKGKAPRELAEKQLNKSKVYQETLTELAKKAYPEAIKKAAVEPYGQPKIEVVEANPDKPWQLHIIIAQKPTITLGDYKKAIADIKAEKKTKNIWVPGKSEKKEEKPNTKPAIGELLEALYKTTTIEIADLIVEQEVDRMLSQLLQDIQKLGLTLDRYLASANKTNEQLITEYQQQARRTITLELALETLATNEKITVEDKEIEEFINKSKEPAEKKALEGQKYYLAHILRRQKTMDFLSSI